MYTMELFKQNGGTGNMSTKDHEETRRQFLQKSAFAVGMAGSGLITTGSAEAELDCNTKNTGSITDYPWDVGVDCAARATLYLVDGRRIGNIILDDLSATFDHMRDRALAATGDDRQKLTDAINDLEAGDPYTINDLAAALEVASLKCTSRLSYAGHASQTLSTDLEPALRELEKMICVPLLNTDPGDISTFLTWERRRDIDWHGRPQNGQHISNGRQLKELFVRRHGAINHQKHPDPQSRGELYLWHSVRDSGLLWCAPRKKPWIRRGDKTFHVTRSGELEVKVVPNDRKCVEGRCAPNYPGEYCQEVDNSCNGMST